MKFILLCVLFLLLMAMFIQNTDASRKKPSSARGCRRLSQNLGTSTTTSTQPESLKQIINQGMDQLHLDEPPNPAIFLLGNVKSDQGTLMQILAGNFSELQVVRTQNGQSVIVDDKDNLVGMPKLVSEYLVNPENNLSFYNLPPFFDENRDEDSDIASIYFTNSIMENVKQAKFLIVVPHSSIIATDKLDLDLLITYLSSFLWDTSKFQDSIALIITNVNPYVFGYPMEDDEILEGIVETLELYRYSVNESISEKGISWSEGSRRRRKVKLVEALLRQDDENDNTFSKISFVKVPPRCGQLSQIQYFSEKRQDLTDLLQNNLLYTPISSSREFDYTFTEKTKHKIWQVYVAPMLDELRNKTEKVLAELIKNYQKEVEMEFGKDESSMEDTLLKLTRIYTNLTSYSLRQNLLQDVQNFFAIFETPVPESYWNKSQEQEKMLSFFEKVTGTPIFRPSLDSSHSQLRKGIRAMRERMWNFVRDLSIPETLSKMEEIGTLLVGKLEKNYLQKFYEGLSQITVHDKAALLKTQEEQLSALGETWNTMLISYTSASSNFTIASEIKALYSKFGLPVFPEKIVVLGKLERKLDMFVEVMQTGIKGHFIRYEVGSEWENIEPIKRPLSDWLEVGGAQDFLRKIQFLSNWYYFLVKTNDELQLYQTQKDIDAVRESVSVSNPSQALHHLKRLRPSLFSWGIEQTFQKHLTEKDKQLFLEIVGNAFSRTRVECLNHGSKALITGSFVKVSDFMPKDRLPCYHEILSEIEVFATDVIYFDSDIIAKRTKGSKTPITVKIMVNKWNVVGANRTVDISGYDGEQFAESAGAGKAGSPGSLGTNGGNFYGIYSTFVGGDELTINLDGGNGGNGQNGESDGGSAGEGGYGGFSEIIDVNWNESRTKSSKIIVTRNRGLNGTAGRGENGIDGTNSEGKTSPAWPSYPQAHDISGERLTFYKKLTLESGSRFGRQFIRTFEMNRHHITHIFYANLHNDVAQYLINLETMFYEQKLDFQVVIEEYEELLGRIKNYLIMSYQRSLRLVPDKFKALNDLYVTILSKLISFREPKRQPCSNIIGNNATAYFIGVQDEIDKLKVADMQLEFVKQSNIIESQLVAKLAEVQSFISSNMFLALNLFETIFNEETQAIKVEMEEKEILEEKREINALERRLRSVGIKHKLVESFSLVGTVATFFGEVGIEAVQIVNLTSPLNSSFDADEPYVVQRIVTLPQHLNSLIENHRLKYMRNKNQSIPLVTHASHQLLLEREDLLGALSTPLSNVEDAYANLQNISTNSEAVKPENIFATEQRFQTKLMEFQAAVLNIKNELGQNETELIAQLKDLIFMLAFLDTNSDLVNSLYENSSVKLDLVEKALNVETRTMQIYNNLIPTLQTTMKSIIQQPKDPRKWLNSYSMGLGVRKWKVKNMLTELKDGLEQLVSEPNAVEKAKDQCVFALLEALTKLIDLYDLLEKYEDMKQLEIFYTIFSSTENRNPTTVSLANGQSLTAPYRGLSEEVTSKLSFFIKANQILYRYSKAVNTLKKLVYQNQNMADFNYSSDFKSLEGPFQHQDLDGMANVYIQKIEELLEKHKGILFAHDVNRFFSKYSSTQTLYVFDSEFQEYVQDLLSGNQIQLFPHTQRTEWKYAAIAFKTIELYLRASNDSMQLELDEKLLHYRVKMTHSGVSYFKIFSEDFYNENGEKTFQHGFGKRRSSCFDHGNKTDVEYELNCEEDSLRSPYTMWTFQLIDTSQSSSDFEDLSRFAPFVSLELHGEGLYLDEEKTDENTILQLNIQNLFLNSKESSNENINIFDLPLWKSLNCQPFVRKLQF